MENGSIDSKRIIGTIGYDNQSKLEEFKHYLYSVNGFINRLRNNYVEVKSTVDKYIRFKQFEEILESIKKEIKDGNIKQEDLEIFIISFTAYSDSLKEDNGGNCNGNDEERKYEHFLNSECGRISMEVKKFLEAPRGK